MLLHNGVEQNEVHYGSHLPKSGDRCRKHRNFFQLSP
jgi:hypothetical protein